MGATADGVAAWAGTVALVSVFVSVFTFISTRFSGVRRTLLEPGPAVRDSPEPLGEVRPPDRVRPLDGFRRRLLEGQDNGPRLPLWGWKIFLALGVGAGVVWLVAVLA
jgi:hypothetical protein